MMFRKKKTPLTPGGQAVPRGRTSPAKGEGTARKAAGNPLARRFQAESEPPTIDLAAAPRFQPAQPGSDDPKTAALRTDSAQLSPIISFEPGTGKFYLHPGSGVLPVILQGEPVAAPTELRRGDVIRVGEAEFQFHSRP